MGKEGELVGNPVTVGGIDGVGVSSSSSSSSSSSPSVNA